MAILMERHENKVIIGNMYIEIPTDRSVLSIVGANKEISDQYKFKKDGWIYKDSKKVKKWFITVNNVRVRKSVLDDIDKLEARYSVVRSRWLKFIDKKWKPINDAVLRTGGCHVQPVHVKNNPEGLWWFYTVKDNGCTSSSKYVSFEWVPKPKHPKNLKLGQRYYEVERQVTRYASFVYKFRVVLEEAINNFLYKYTPQKPNQVLQLTINGKIYWYASIYNKFGVLTWSKLCWPEDDVIQLKL